MDFNSYCTTENDADRRLDRIVRRFMPGVPLSGIYRLVRKGLIRVDNKRVKPECKVPEGACINIAVSVSSGDIPPENKHSPALPVDIVFQSEDLLFVNKPRGIPVHGPGGLDRMIPPSDAQNASLSFRSGPLHRLDKETSGLVTVSKTLKGARWFTAVMREHRLGKFYLGIADGALEKPEHWEDTDEEGRTMLTHVHPLAVSQDASNGVKTLVYYQILTGKKHQIRKQSRIHGFPLSGDVRYGGSDNAEGYFLHAWKMRLPDDRPGDMPETITARRPADMDRKIALLFGDIVLAKLDTHNVY